MDWSPAPTGRGDADCAALRYSSNDGEEHLFLLHAHAPRIVIGRREGCDLAITWDTLVSGQHAILELVGTHWYVTDDGSRNGTHVNSERVSQRRKLTGDDRILVGRTLLTFWEPPDPGPVTKSAKTPVLSLTEAQGRVLRSLCAPLHTDATELPATNLAIAKELHISIDAVKY
jgi:hypothetical protein